MNRLSILLLVLSITTYVKSIVGSFLAPRTSGQLRRSDFLGLQRRLQSTSIDLKDNESKAPKTTKKKSEAVAKMVSLVEESIRNKSFVSLTLQGVKKKKGQEDSFLRGSIRQVQGRLIEVKKQELLQLTLKYHGATDVCKNLNLEQITEKLPELILDPLASEWGVEAVQARPIQGAELKTISSIWDLRLDKAALVEQKVKVPQTRSEPLSHDRTKQVPLSNQADFFQALGVTRPDGKPRPGMTSKLRQCQKFVEIVGGLLNKLPTERPISVMDMGCGRGYLTFALHSYLSKRYDSVKSLGIDVRPKLVEEISNISKSLGGEFDTLYFEEGTIEDVVAEAASVRNQTHNSHDILIALHACDTASDDALWSGICRGVDLIVVAPCCHKQVRPQLNAHFAAESNTHPLADVLKHGVYRERLSETATDSLRALLLEKAGYAVQVFEFIGGEHTSKNVMITAIKSGQVKDVQVIQKKIEVLASFHGIRQQKLAEWMGEDLGEPKGESEQGSRVATHQMPPFQQ